MSQIQPTPEPTPARPISSDVNYEMLNALLYGRHGGWRVVNARKNHVDMFDSPIDSGFDHYVRSVGMGYTELERLSKESMDRILDAVFLGNPALADAARKAVKMREDGVMNELRVAMGIIDLKPVAD